WTGSLYYSDRRADPSFAHELTGLRRAGVRLRRLPMAASPLDRGNLQAARRIARDLADHFPAADVILHGHSSIGGACARLASGLFWRGARPRATFYTPHTPSTQFDQLSRHRRRAYLTA